MHAVEHYGTSRAKTDSAHSRRPARTPQNIKNLDAVRGKCHSQCPPFLKYLREQSTWKAPEEEFISSHERRIAPRKSYAIPARFNVITEQYAMVGVAGAATVPAHANAKLFSTIALPQHGEIVNLSERGIGFKTRQSLNVVENVEIFFTLPTALTVRVPEDVRCSARVVRVEKDRETNGMMAIGAAIDRLERTAATRNWAN